MLYPRSRRRLFACLLPLALTLFGWFAILVVVGLDAGCGGASIHVPGNEPIRIASTSTQKVFVALQDIAGASAPRSSCLTQLDLVGSAPVVLPAPQTEVSTLTDSPQLQADAAGDKGSRVYPPRRNPSSPFQRRSTKPPAFAPTSHLI